MDFRLIQPSEIEGQVKRGAILIDVREPEEYRTFHYPNAKNIPYDRLEAWKRRLPRSRPLVLYCEHGSTSLMAARMLGREGFEVYTVIGGLEAMKKVDRHL